jgi:glutaminyl-tRNA synthetase
MEAEGVVLSKRKLNALVTEAKVAGWGAPEMPTVSGLRARGYTASMLREFVTRCGFGRSNSTVPLTVLDECVCDELGPSADRRMAVLDPVELVLSNLEAPLAASVPNHPKDASRGARALTLTERVWVERDDVRVAPEDGFWRLAPGNWVRLKHGLNICVTSVETDEAGRAVRVHADVDPASVDMKAAKHKAKAVIHWLSDVDSREAPVLRYGSLFDGAGNFNEAAVTRVSARVEHGLAPATHYEFERVGYFWSDPDGRLHHLAKLKGPKPKAA